MLVHQTLAIMSDFIMLISQYITCTPICPKLLYLQCDSVFKPVLGPYSVHSKGTVLHPQMHYSQPKTFLNHSNVQPSYPFTPSGLGSSSMTLFALLLCFFIFLDTKLSHPVLHGWQLLVPLADLLPTLFNPSSYRNIISLFEFPNGLIMTERV